MKIVKLEYESLVFLYAYLRQIDLSLDRARWDTWENLVKYYSTNISQKKVSGKLKNYQLISVSKGVYYFNRISNVFLQKVISRVYGPIYSKVFFQITDVSKCIEFLDRFDQLLHEEFNDYPKKAEILRVEIAKYYSFVLGSRISNKDLNRVMKVEHFLQNDKILKTIKIENFSKDIW